MASATELFRTYAAIAPRSRPRDCGRGIHGGLIANDIIRLYAWSNFNPRYWAQLVIKCILLHCYPNKRVRLIAQFYGTKNGYVQDVSMLER